MDHHDRKAAYLRSGHRGLTIRVCIYIYNIYIYIYMSNYCSINCIRCPVKRHVGRLIFERTIHGELWHENAPSDRAKHYTALFNAGHRASWSASDTATRERERERERAVTYQADGHQITNAVLAAVVTLFVSSGSIEARCRFIVMHARYTQPPK